MSSPNQNSSTSNQDLAAKIKPFAISIVIAGVVIILDQFSKYYVFNLLHNLDTKELAILPFFNLVTVYNYGVSFGMFNDLNYGSTILSVITAIITLVLLIWLWRCTNKYSRLALAFVIGGAIGNIIDRIMYGAVADFLDFYIGTYHWPAFNVADSCIFIGVCLLIFEPKSKI